MDLITKKVKQCYEETPFPNTLQNSSDFEEELDKIIFWLKLNLKYLNLNDWTPHNILCAGCGTGEEAIALAKIFPNAHITAIDLSRASLEIAKKNIERAGLKIVLKQMSIYDLPQTKYDLVFCVGVIHHLSDPEKGFKVLSECARGKYIICLYNTYGLFFYKLQLKLLGLLPNRRKWAQRLFKRDSKAAFFDSYLNPQVNTYTIQQVMRWGQKINLTLTSVCPPISVSGLICFAEEGINYVLRRKGLTKTVLKIVSYLKLKKIHLSNLFLIQLIYLILGKGECFYLFENKKGN